MREIGALNLKDLKPAFVPLGVTRRGIRAKGFFAGVIDLEREDGQAVDHEAGRLGVERGVGVGQELRLEIIEQGLVELLHEIVAKLVGAIDATFDVSEQRVRNPRGASLVFDVPQIEVGAMMAGDTGDPLIRLGIDGGS